VRRERAGEGVARAYLEDRGARLRPKTSQESSREPGPLLICRVYNHLGVKEVVQALRFCTGCEKGPTQKKKRENDRDEGGRGGEKVKKNNHSQAIDREAKPVGGPGKNLAPEMGTKKIRDRRDTDGWKLSVGICKRSGVSMAL